MSRTLDLLTDSNIHGTPDGYRAGCKTGHCPSPVICRDVYIRYVGDFTFARRFDSGMTAVEIVAAEVADAEARRVRDKEAARAEKRAENAKQAKREARKERTAKRVPKPVKEPRRTYADMHGAEVARLHGQGMSDARIAKALSLTPATVHHVRARVLHLPAVPSSIGGVPPDRFPEVVALHGEGLTDLGIAERMGVDRLAVWKIRRKLGLPLIPAPRGTRTPPAESSHLVEIRRLHAQGMSDGEIGKAIGISKAWANALRNRLGLPANVKGRVRSFVEQPHGVFARYRSGCRCGECRAANAAQAAKYRRAS